MYVPKNGTPFTIIFAEHISYQTENDFKRVSCSGDADSRRIICRWRRRVGPTRRGGIGIESESQGDSPLLTVRGIAQGESFQ